MITIRAEFMCNYHHRKRHGMKELKPAERKRSCIPDTDVATSRHFMNMLHVCLSGTLTRYLNCLKVEGR